MTIEELIIALQKLDPKLRVVVQGYEGGYNDVGLVVPVELALNVHAGWYMGPHEKSDDYNVKPEHKLENAVLIL